MTQQVSQQLGFAFLQVFCYQQQRTCAQIHTHTHTLFFRCSQAHTHSHHTQVHCTHTHSHICAHIIQTYTPHCTHGKQGSMGTKPPLAFGNDKSGNGRLGSPTSVYLNMHRYIYKHLLKCPSMLIVIVTWHSILVQVSFVN